ncbi:recombinase family protein [Streptomyces sp. NPDC094438]|uniref:recombinase family protein n=1 Tax=Streptomyces sp. NPDC094438 TaxID=3366061 RepID=UPI0038062047
MTTPTATAPVGKVTSEHLRRDAYLYVRQSTLKQVLNNTESTTRQYALRTRAIALGWDYSQVIVIDTDQGQSGASAEGRDGFQYLVAEVGLGHAGVVLGLEVSRLARNNTDWHRLVDICALTGTLILDEDGLYDPGNFNDRLLLGLKGTMSEVELHLLKARLRGGTLSKARRGELILPLPVGLVRDGTGKVVLDPDASVRQAVRHFFDTFTATGSATATVKAFATAGLKFPRRLRSGPRKGELVWGLLQHSRALQILHNPRYAGAYFYGRRQQTRGPGGRTQHRIRPRDEWTILITEAHVGYLTWADFEANQLRLAELAAAHGLDRRAGPPREGSALLQGLVICGRCGHRMTVRYRMIKGGPSPYYACQYEGIKTATRICQSLPGRDIDTAVARLLLDKLTPLALEVALQVADELAARADDADRLRAACVERARYQADLARRRYMAVDPGNRLVADTLEAEWNAALRELADARDEYERASRTATAPDPAQRARITALASDFPRLWHDPATPMRERKRMVRLLVADVTLDRTDTVNAGVRLHGGQHHRFTLPLPLSAGELRKNQAEVVALVDELLDRHTHAEIADILNERGFLSIEGTAFHRLMVRNIRDAYGLRSRFDRLRAKGLLTLDEISEQLGTTPATVKHWRLAGVLDAVRYDDKGQCLYPPPGPNPPRPHRGRRLSRRRLDSRELLSTSAGGAV